MDKGILEIMYNSPITQMHIELTNRCNAACPSCPRTGESRGHMADHISNSGWHDLSLDDIKNICSNIPTLKWVNLCGNFGDPAVAPEFKEIVKYFNKKEIDVWISTNGAPRTPKYWAELAHPKTTIQWHIDGDEDTNHIYRVGTNFQKIMNNAKAYIDAGGKANWTFIPFAHNEHVIDKCKKMSEDMGFYTFKIKKSYRVGNNSKSQPIELPKNKKYLNAVVNKKKEKVISCKVQNENEIFLACDGDVFPCCWTGADFWFKKYKSKERKNYSQLNSNYLINFDNNFRTNNIKNIIDSYIERRNTWELIWDCKEYYICNRNCGTNKWSDRYLKVNNQ
jgi:MoaA/NifB/PqqE/SkfB family radical SAM enzyme